MHTTDTEVVIIGAGLAGLTSAILLGEMGIKAVVIERSPVPGGLMRSYARQGIDCTVGLHYFGLAGEGELLRQMFDILGVTEGLKLRRLGTQGVLERYIFDDMTFTLPATLPAFKQTLYDLCPDETDAIDTVISALQAMSRGLRLDAGGTLQSSPFSVAGADQSMEKFLRPPAASRRNSTMFSASTVSGPVCPWTNVPRICFYTPLAAFCCRPGTSAAPVDRWPISMPSAHGKQGPTCCSVIRWNGFFCMKGVPAVSG